MTLLSGQALMAMIFSACDRCLRTVVRVYPSPSPAYEYVCADCGSGNNTGFVSK